MCLRIVRVSERLYILVPINQVFRDIVPKSGYLRFVDSLDLTLILRVIRRYGEVLNAKESA